MGLYWRLLNSFPPPPPITITIQTHLTNPDFWTNAEIFWCTKLPLLWSYKHARKLIYLLLYYVQMLIGGGRRNGHPGFVLENDKSYDWMSNSGPITTQTSPSIHHYFTHSLISGATCQSARSSHTSLSHASPALSSPDANAYQQTNKTFDISTSLFV